jgi:hypothetical protein
MPALPELNLTRGHIFGEVDRPEETFIHLKDWDKPVTFFVGRNGSGKTRAATTIAASVGAKRLATDRLIGLMVFQNYGYTSTPNIEGFRGAPLGANERQNSAQLSGQFGTAIDDMYALREQPEVWLRVAAFVRRVLGRHIELRETAGYLDPFVRIDRSSYSLLREEGHGLRELVVLLTAVYRSDWRYLVIDEPELHLHPAMARLWLSELQTECAATDRNAFVITHEPNLLQPTSADDLESIWFFAPKAAPQCVGGAVLAAQKSRVDASLTENPDLVSKLMFSPRPVLVEGIHDVAALSTAIKRTLPAEVAAQTDLVSCGGTSGVALWFEIATKLGCDVRAVADLDALFDSSVARAMDTRPGVSERYRSELGLEPATTAEALRPVQARMARDHVGAEPRSKAEWLAELTGDGHEALRDNLLGIWRDSGLWLHPQGRLEQVLGITDKGGDKARAAAANPGPIDDVASWASYKLDPQGEVALLLGVEVERIAQNVIRELRLDAGAQLTTPPGPSAESDARLVDIQPLGDGKHRLTVKRPVAFQGWWMDFSRDTPASQFTLSEPAPAGGMTA